MFFDLEEGLDCGNDRNRISRWSNGLLTLSSFFADGRKGGDFSFVQVSGRVDEARLPGRVPHVRPGVHPDFLLSSLALTNFMRLSLMKAAHALVGAPRQEIRVTYGITRYCSNFPSGIW